MVGEATVCQETPVRLLHFLVLSPTLFAPVRTARAGVPAPTDAQSSKHVCATRAEEGQELRDRGKLQEARASFIACAEATCPALVARACTGFLSEVLTRIPSLVVGVRDPHGADLDGPSIFLDGKLQTQPGYAALALDPGPHLLRIEHEGYAPWQEHIVLREAEKNRRVDVTLVPLTPAPQKRHRRRDPPLPLYTAGGVSILGFATFGFFGARGLSHYRDADTCSPRCPESDVSRVQTEFLVADIGLVVGAIGAGALLAQWLLWNR